MFSFSNSARSCARNHSGAARSALIAPFSGAGLLLLSASLRLLGLALACGGTTPALAAWSSNPAVNNAVSTATGNQVTVRMISDGAGGTIEIWEDVRNGNSDIYAQRLDANGVPQWTANGVALCTATNLQFNQQLVSDGAGGAVVVWQDFRSGTSADLYAQRVDSSGVTQWTANGIGLCTAANDQSKPQLVSDGSGGAVFTWEDGRLGGSNTDIYVQRVNSAGAAQWTADGFALCTATGAQVSPQLVSDGSGGAVVTWQDARSGGTNLNIYGQRVNSSGAPQWTANGVEVCTAIANQTAPRLVSDGSGGAVVTWQDFRSGSGTDLYAQRINSSGAAQWTANGIALCTATGSQASPQLVSDGLGGAVVTWHDSRNGSIMDIYAQRVDSLGAAQWTPDGVALCAATDNQFSPELVSDGLGGAVVTWYDFRSGSSYDIYAQRVNSSGATQWMSNGVAVSTAIADQQFPQLVSDGSGGAVVSWQDGRSGTDNDIYASRISSSGGLVPVSLSGFTLE